jgi:hypothetical protein
MFDLKAFEEEAAKPLHVYEADAVYSCFILKLICIRVHQQLN